MGGGETRLPRKEDERRQLDGTELHVDGPQSSGAGTARVSNVSVTARKTGNGRDLIASREPSEDIG